MEGSKQWWKGPSLKSDLIYLLVMSLRFLMSMEQNQRSYLYSSVILKYLQHLLIQLYNSTQVPAPIDGNSFLKFWVKKDSKTTSRIMGKECYN